MERKVKMKEIILQGHGAAKGIAEGEALVTQDAIAFSGSIHLARGIIADPRSQIKGASVTDKILVFPTGKGSTADPYGFYILKKGGKAPKAVINTEANPTTVVGAIISNVPMVYQLDRDPIQVIETGDHVRVDGEKGTVTVIKKERL